MPNYVKNIITFENPEDFQTMVDLTISEKDDKTLFFDFNRVIRPPEELNITDSSAGSNGMDYLLNPQLFVEGKKDMLMDSIKESEILLSYYNKAKGSITDKIIEVIENNRENFYNLNLDLGQKYINNLERFGAKTWYQWSNINWGTKWNSMETNINYEKKTISFLTAWSPPFPIFEKLFQRNNFKFNVIYADEGSCFAGITKFIINEDGTKEIEDQDYEINNKSSVIGLIFNERINLINKYLIKKEDLTEEEQNLEIDR